MTTTGEHWNEWQLLEGFPLWSPDVAANYESRANVLGINAWECAILQSIWYDYGQVRSKDLLADRAFGVSGKKYPSKATAAIERCFSDGFIQFLTADFLSELKTELDAGGYLQPGGLIGTFFRMKSVSSASLVKVPGCTRNGSNLTQTHQNTSRLVQKLVRGAKSMEPQKNGVGMPLRAIEMNTSSKAQPSRLVAGVTVGGIDSKVGFY